MLIRKIGDFVLACIEGILQSFTIFYLDRKISKFLTNDCDCKAVEACWKKRYQPALPHGAVP